MEPKTYIVLKKVAVNGKHFIEGDVFQASLTKSVESEGLNRKLYRLANEDELEKTTSAPEKKVKK
jgi:hypothetical protein